MTALFLGSWLVAATLLAGTPGERAVDFDTEVIPLLTCAGCNAGACHGAAAGRGGFRLSLFGSDPARDHDAIVRELEGRRVDLARPDESLVLAKPSGQIDHEGGVRLPMGGAGFGRLRDWLRAGAPRETRRRLEGFRVEPAEAVVAAKGDRVGLRALARFDDVTEEDVTPWAVFQAADPGSVATSFEGGRARVRVERPGRHVVLARFLDRVLPITLTLPIGEETPDLSREPRRNFIDDEVLATLAALRLAPAPPVADAAFLRRARLDLTGRLPDPEERRAFLADPDPSRRDRLIDRLLASEDFATYWASRLGELLRLGAAGQDAEGARALLDWLRDAVGRGRPYPAVARELLTATGDPRLYGPAHFYKVVADPRSQAEYAAEVFLGARLRCANCHNHPLDRWTQDDYHGLAALFARVERDAAGIVRLAGRGEVTHPATGEPARPRIPGTRDLDPVAEPDGRAALADWLADPANPLPARAVVNRLWKALMGRGLVEPADDHRETNPATHPVLLDRLAADFAAHGHDLRHTLRRIATSAAYGRGPATTEAQRLDDRFYSRAIEKPLSAEVLIDAWSDVSGVPEPFEGHAVGTRAVALVGPQVSSESLDLLGRCRRGDACESTPAAGGLASALHRLNGPVLNRRLADPSGRLRSLLATGRPPLEVLDEFYLRALCRLPNAAERAFWGSQIADAGPPDAARIAALEDIVWSLLNGSEFLNSH